MIATIVNTIAIMIGSVIGFLFKKAISFDLQESLMKVLGLVVVYIGITSMMDTDNVLILILSLTIGTLIGELVNLESKLNKLLLTVEKRFSEDRESGWFVQGFLSASLLFGVGAMAIVGAFESGLYGNHEILYTKSMLDFVAAMMLTTTLGIGVFFSGFVILIYQGALTFLASFLSSVLTTAMITSMSSVGGALIFALGLNMIKATNIKVINMIFAIGLALLLPLVF